MKITGFDRKKASCWIKVLIMALTVTLIFLLLECIYEMQALRASEKERYEYRMHLQENVDNRGIKIDDSDSQ